MQLRYCSTSIARLISISEKPLRAVALSLNLHAAKSMGPGSHGSTAPSPAPDEWTGQTWLPGLGLGSAAVLPRWGKQPLTAISGCAVGYPSIADRNLLTIKCRSGRGPVMCRHHFSPSAIGRRWKNRSWPQSDFTGSDCWRPRKAMAGRCCCLCTQYVHLTATKTLRSISLRLGAELNSGCSGSNALRAIKDSATSGRTRHP